MTRQSVCYAIVTILQARPEPTGTDSGVLMSTPRTASPTAPDLAAPDNWLHWLSRLLDGARAGGPQTIVTALGLIGLMMLGSVIMWLGIPLGWLWLASPLPNGVGNPSPGPY